MERGTTQLLALVGSGDGRVRSEVVPKGQVPFHMGRTLRKTVKLWHPLARLIVLGEATSACNPKLTPTARPQALQDRHRLIQQCKVSDHRHQIQNRLSRQAIHRRGTHGVNPSTKHRTQRTLQPLHLPLSKLRPSLRVGNDLDSDGR